MMRRGFLTLDSLIGLAIIGVMTTLVVVSMTRFRAASETFADQRAAARATTEALLSLQQSGPPPTLDASRFKIEPIEHAAPDGWRWVNIRCTIGRGHSEMLALVRNQP